MWVALARGHAIKPRSGYRLQEAAERTPDSVIDRNFSAGSRARIAQPEALFRPGQRKREREGGGSAYFGRHISEYYGDDTETLRSGNRSGYSDIVVCPELPAAVSECPARAGKFLDIEFAARDGGSFVNDERTSFWNLEK
jgi:hypothetical protein